MSGEIVLEANDLSKLYARRPLATRRRLGKAFGRTLVGRRVAAIDRPAPNEFWALSEVAFTLKRGEALGVIGLNGSGKTTLLRILAGQILPDRGEVRIRGEVGAMIDLTAGFQMSASGRANILLRGAALGRSRKTMVAAADEIIAFAEIGDAIDAPVSTYSAGMTMRLAFAITVAAAPDLLLIDEILAVGDFRFRQKCLSKLREIREKSSFVLVSHSMGDIRRFCDRVMVLDKGKVAFIGEADRAIELYEEMGTPATVLSEEERHRSIVAPLLENTSALTALSHFWCDETGAEIDEVRQGNPLHFRVTFTLAIRPRRLVVGVPIWADGGEYVTGFSSEITDDEFDVGPGVPSTITLTIDQVAFNPGLYLSSVGIMDGPEHLYRKPNPPLRVRGVGKPSWGTVTLPHSWKLDTEGGSAEAIQPRIGRDIA